MKLSQTAIAVVFLLAGLALEPQTQQFVLRVLELEPGITSEEELPSTVPLNVVTTPNDLLIKEGKRLGVLSLHGKQHPILQLAAERHASYQAVRGVQSHQLWLHRMSELQRELPGLRFQEVANESWPGQSVKDAAREMFRSWRLSDGHWAVVDGKYKYYGYAMALSSNGTWYACGIVGK